MLKVRILKGNLEIILARRNISQSVTNAEMIEALEEIYPNNKEEVCIIYFELIKEWKAK